VGEVKTVATEAGCWGAGTDRNGRVLRR